jgi:uncharacterized protein (DUF433 family)
VSEKRPKKTPDAGTGGSERAAFVPIPGIERTPGPYGYAYIKLKGRIKGGRALVWKLERSRRRGLGEAEIAVAYGLSFRDIENVWAYVDANPDEIERQILEAAHLEAEENTRLESRVSQAAHRGTGGETGGRSRVDVRAIPGIEKTPGVCGGDPCIRQTRIPVWLIEHCRQLGYTEAELLDSYPGLQAQDLVNAWAYVQAHRDEIERQILENESD